VGAPLLHQVTFDFNSLPRYNKAQIGFPFLRAANVHCEDYRISFLRPVSSRGFNLPGIVGPEFRLVTWTGGGEHSTFVDSELMETQTFRYQSSDLMG